MAGVIARGRVVQIAYMCEAAGFEATLDAWAGSFGVGPFWSFESTPLNQTYRGEPTMASVRAAMTYLGGVQLEVLAPLDRQPSAWSDWDVPVSGLPACGVFHHVLVESDDIDATIAGLLRSGAQEGWAARLADGRRVAYVDARATSGHFVEVIEPSAAAEAVRDRMRAICADWKGDRPRRDYTELR